MEWIKTDIYNKNPRKFSKNSNVVDEVKSALTSYTKREDAAIERRKKRIMEALRRKFSAGKISRSEYESLKKRMKDISDELVVFGNSAGVILGKKYVCGTLSKEDFNQI